jgi:Mitochondrial carrier protein.
MSLNTASADQLQTYPLDTRKTRAQSILLGKTKEIGEASAATARSNIYKGLSVSLLRTCVNNMVLLSLFEYIKTKINELDG